MKGLFKTFLSIALLCSFAYAQETELPNLKKPNEIFDIEQSCATNYPKITKIEEFLFKKDYSGEAVESRLERIEFKLFAKCYNNASLAQRVDNIEQNIDSVQMAGISGEKLSLLEKRVFNRSFGLDDAQSRIERLEQKLLGAIQSGDPASRFNTLETALQNSNHNNAPSYATFDPSQNPKVMSQKMNSAAVAQNIPIAKAKGGFFNFLGNMLQTGTMTGFTMPTYAPSPYDLMINGANSQGAHSQNGLYETWRSNSDGGCGATIFY